MMNYYMQGSSETIISSEEESDHDQDHQDDDDSAKRSYECTFCRRGFTNAQALGGHMNIHRKDRAKAKKLFGTPNNNNLSSSSLPRKYYTTTHDEESMASSFVPPQISSSSAAPAAYAFQYEFLSTTRYHHHHHNNQSLGTNHQDHLLGPNLSLQIGPSHHHVVNTDQVRRGIHQKDGTDVVDLELRLGHHPCSNY